MVSYQKLLPKKVQNFPVEIVWEDRYCSLSKGYIPFLEKSPNFHVRDDDIWIVTMPKAGTTWMQEMAWLILNDLDFEKAKAQKQTERSPFFEQEILTPNKSQYLDDCPSPRVIKSHLPMPFLPKELWSSKAKIIYVTRNPKDIAVSDYHFSKAVGIIAKDVSIATYIGNYVNHRILYGPYWDHVLEFWKLRKDPKVFFTNYERMKMDTQNVIVELCKFLDKPIPTHQMEQLIDHLSFNKMKDNPSCNPTTLMDDVKSATNYLKNRDSNGQNSKFRFMRRGIIGSYEEELSKDLIDLIDMRSQEYWEKYCVNPDDMFADKRVENRL